MHALSLFRSNWPHVTLLLSVRTSWNEMIILGLSKIEVTPVKDEPERYWKVITIADIWRMCDSVTYFSKPVLGKSARFGLFRLGSSVSVCLSVCLSLCVCYFRSHRSYLRENQICKNDFVSFFTCAIEWSHY